jgi:hypothetical protein
MNEEMIFRIVFWVFSSLLFVFNRVVPALHARPSGQRLIPDKNAIKNEGKLYLVLRLFLFLLLISFIVVYSVYLPLMDAIHLKLPTWSRWLGTAIALIGVVFWVYSQRVLDKYWLPILFILPVTNVSILYDSN